MKKKEEPYSQNAQRFIVPFSLNEPISHENMISQRTFDHYCSLTRSHCGENDLKGYFGKRRTVNIAILFYLIQIQQQFKVTIVFDIHISKLNHIRYCSIYCSSIL